MERLGERTIWVDCDVIQADGGTRTASITGGFVALVLALQKCASRSDQSASGRPTTSPPPASASINGVADAGPRYEEDSKAEVDMNMIKTGPGRFIEVQGTAEGKPFDRDALDGLIDLAGAGITALVGLQREHVGSLLG